MLTLKRNDEFQHIFKIGKWYGSELLVIYVNSNNNDINRIGIAVGKKIAKSVKRNRIRRVIREAYRLHENEISKGYDIIILWRNIEGFENTKLYIVEENLISALKKANLII